MVSAKFGIRGVEGDAVFNVLSLLIQSKLGLRINKALDQPDRGTLIDLENVPGCKYLRLRFCIKKPLNFGIVHRTFKNRTISPTNRGLRSERMPGN